MSDADRSRTRRESDPQPDSDADSGLGSDADTVADPRSENAPPRRRAVLAYALLFSLPVGVGVAVMLLQVTGGRPTDALVAGPSLALAAGVFALVVAIGVGGSREP